MLIVDDDCDIRDGLSNALAGEGYAVCEAVDGEDALALLTTMAIHPHLVLLDMLMPRMNGYEFLAAIALRPEFDALPVVVVSAYRTLALGRAREVIKKPVDLDALLALVAKVCSERPLRVEDDLD